MHASHLSPILRLPNDDLGKSDDIFERRFIQVTFRNLPSGEQQIAQFQAPT